MLSRLRLPLPPLLAALLLACSADDPHTITAPDLEPNRAMESSHAPDSRLQVGVSALVVKRLNGNRPYAVEGGLDNGARAYIDRTYVYEEVPDLVRGATYIQTAQGEQESTGDDQLLTFRVDRDAMVYIAYHGDSPPSWVGRRGFVSTGMSLVVAKDRERSVHSLYARAFPAGEVTLGSNRRGSGSAEPEMYTVILRPQLDWQGDFASISAGFHHSCGLTPEGTAYCWGEGANGRLGDGTPRRRTQPVEVAGGLTFKSISAGAYHTCGLTELGAAYCWGRNSHGQLGDGTRRGANEPVRVGGGIEFASVAAGGSFSCGVATDGVAYCWGSNSRGQLGVGGEWHRVATEPVALEVAGRFASISASWEHACGVLENGDALCWGKNDFGQLGNGTTRHAATPVQVRGGVTFASVVAGGAGTGPGGAGQNHTCGLSTSGQAYCWGDNWHNPLGLNNTRGVRSEPQPVRDVPALVQVVTGGDHSCGITDAGEAWCWGDNSRGQLGAGDGTTYGSARRVGGEHRFSSLTLGWDHSCGVTTEGEGLCWGWNSRGQLGEGSTHTRRNPVAIVRG